MIQCMRFVVRGSRISDSSADLVGGGGAYRPSVGRRNDTTRVLCPEIARCHNASERRVRIRLLFINVLTEMTEPRYTVIRNPEPPSLLYSTKLLHDYYRPLTKNALKEQWADDELFREHGRDGKHEVSIRDSLAIRDTLNKAMQERDVYPSEWTSEREARAGLYPDIADPDFATKLYKKTEFSELRSGIVPDDVCQTKEDEGFEATPVQRLVARYLHPKTPYRSILLDHGVGVGKSCSAITVAETFLESMPQNQVFILCPQAIASGFKRTIFDIERLTPLSKADAKMRGELWQSSQCTGMTYLRLTGTENEPDKNVIENAVEYVVRKRYRIMGYLAFANWILKKFEKQIPKTYQGQTRRDAENKIILELFSDHLIIVDEAHNLRDIEGAGEVQEMIGHEGEAMSDETPAQSSATDAAEGKRLTPILRRILTVAEGLRLMMMTATPMYNTAPEILFLLNMLILNDTKDETQLLRHNDFFNRDGSLIQMPNRSDYHDEKRYKADLELAQKARSTLGKYCSRYVSYMRGENPASFPLRLTPPEAAGESLFDDYPTRSLSRTENRVTLNNDIKKIMSALPLVIHKPGPDTVVGNVLRRLLREQSSRAAEAQPVVEEVYRVAQCGDRPNKKVFPFSIADIKAVLKRHNIPHKDRAHRTELCRLLTDELVAEMAAAKRGTEPVAEVPPEPVAEVPPEAGDAPAAAPPVAAADRCGIRKSHRHPFSNDDIITVLRRYKLPTGGTRRQLCERLDDQMLAELQQLHSGGASAAALHEDDPIELSDFVLDQVMQAANITYHWSGDAGSRGWDFYFTEKAGRVKQYVWNAVYNEEDDYTMKLDDVFAPDNIHRHAPKIAAIVKSVTSAKGMAFIFSRYVKAGALPIAVALERAGWTRVLADGSASPILATAKDLYRVPRQCAMCTHKEGQSHIGHEFTPANFVLLTGDDALTPDFRGTLRYANTLNGPIETAGGKVKVIVGSQIASEGLDLKCIRENHLLDGWYHLNRIEQVEGRAVRYCSHAALADRARHNCLIYLHVVSIPEYETADLYAYRLAARKAIPIGQVQRIIKISAWDCNMNKDAILLRGLHPRKVIDAQGRVNNRYDPVDKPYTSICDYHNSCEYECAAANVPAAQAGQDISTYDASDASKRFQEKQKILRAMFRDEIAYPVETIQKTVYADMPWEIGSIGLRNVLNNAKFVVQRRDGIRGMLTLKNGYVMFHPLGVTDPEIPLALRYGRAYGRIPRHMSLQRQTILASERPVPVAAEVAVAAASAADPSLAAAQLAPAAADSAIVAARPVTVDDALERFRQWSDKLEEIGQKSLLDKVAPPAGMPDPFFQGLRFVFRHFSGLAETRPIALRWWTDVEWSQDIKKTLMTKWITEPVPQQERTIVSLFEPSELFRTDQMSGFLAVDIAAAKVTVYCAVGDRPLGPCPSNLLEDVEKITGKPVNRVEGTGSLFGLLNINPKETGAVLFKSVLKNGGKEDGAQCQNNSNLSNGRSRIRHLHGEIRTNTQRGHPILAMLLDDTEERFPDAKAERKKRRITMNLQHIDDLSKNELCSYLEFLLRWMDHTKLAKKRWFLSLIDTGRSYGKLG
jgi:hypothetical protein